MNIELRPLEKVLVENYINTTTSTYNKNYDDVDESMGLHIIKCMNENNDQIGYMTLKKEVFSVFYNEQNIGFTTLTWKRGGSVKTGPTILNPNFRGLGLGPLTQKAIQERVRGLGARKTYGTVSTANLKALSYMLRAGYRIEAQLTKHYSSKYDEIVIGFNFNKNEYKKPTDLAVSNLSKQVDLLYTANLSRADLETYSKIIVGHFDTSLVSVDSTLIRNLINTCTVSLSDFARKPRRIIGVFNASELQGCIILIPKRGGTIKVNLVGNVTLSSVNQAISKFLQDEDGYTFRKFSIFLPYRWTKIEAEIIEQRWALEGVLMEPYRPGENLKIYSKFRHNL